MSVCVNNNEFQPPLEWSQNCESFLISLDEEALECLIDFQYRDTGTLIERPISRIFPDSIGQDELIAVSNKATLIYFGILASRMNDYLEMNNSATMIFYSRRLEIIRPFGDHLPPLFKYMFLTPLKYMLGIVPTTSLDDELPSKIVERILDTFKVKFSRNQDDVNTKKIVQYFYDKGGWQTSLPSCFQRFLGHKTPEEMAEETILQFVKFRNRAFDIISQEKKTVERMQLMMGLVEYQRSQLLEKDAQLEILSEYLNN